jgi:signal transduction histidine kinase
MSIQIPCPRCGQMVDRLARECPHCGVDLALAAVMAEQAVTSAVTIDSTAPITPEILVPRLGEYLMERGVLSQEDLQRALEYSRQPTADGQRRLVGQALLELGLVDRETLDQVITEQILQLQNALQQSNVMLEQRVKERTHELQTALNKLAELNQLKSNFISNVSHELRTPLTHIKGYLDLMVDGSLGNLTKDQTSALDVMLRSEARLEELIEELIQFSLAASGEFTLQMEKVNIATVIDSALKRARNKAKGRSVILNIDLGTEPYIVRLDEEKIQWVVMELVDNAIKFTPPGGQVDISLQKDGDLVQFIVKDTGIGISTERLTEIFEPFHQLDGSSTRRYGGVGLGLSLVRKIIEAHGSTIDVLSEASKGTRIQFHLPIVES